MSNVNILFVGDVVGKPGRWAVYHLLPKLKQQFRPDLTIVNVENAASGFGCTRKMGDAILRWGADIMTSGNHIWDQREALVFIERQDRLLRPVNFPAGTPGKGSGLFETKGGKRGSVPEVVGGKRASVAIGAGASRAAAGKRGSVPDAIGQAFAQGAGATKAKAKQQASSGDLFSSQV